MEVLKKTLTRDNANATVSANNRLMKNFIMTSSFDIEIASFLSFEIEKYWRQPQAFVINGMYEVCEGGREVQI